MENASKALIMAAEILFGVILLTIFIGAYYAWNNVAQDINDNIETTKIHAFNGNFTVYDKTIDPNAHDLTIHDVISLLNFVKEYNKQVEDDDYSKVVITSDSDFGIKENTNISNMAEFIKKYENNYFSLRIVKYNEGTGRVKQIHLNKKII